MSDLLGNVKVCLSCTMVNDGVGWGTVGARLLSGNYQYDNEEFEDALESYKSGLNLLLTKHPTGKPCAECVKTIEDAIKELEHEMKK